MKGNAAMLALLEVGMIHFIAIVSLESYTPKTDA